MGKHQIPSTKIQISANYQVMKSQTGAYCTFGDSLLFGICDLKFGYSITFTLA
jgi:hypothetical protein